MANNKSAATNSFHNKKEIKKELAHNIEIALPEIKSKLGEKKFNKRIKKATKIITEGLRLKKPGHKKNDLAKTELAETQKAAVKNPTKSNSV